MLENQRRGEVMSRPVKFRKVEKLPVCTEFMPIKVGEEEVEKICIKVEELEAMRLKDIEGYNQEQCAELMEVSRQTFQNIIDSARNKVTIALVEGKAIHIGGGHYATKHCKYHCKNCGDDYELEVDYNAYNCPKCGSEKVSCKRRARCCEICDVSK